MVNLLIWLGLIISDTTAQLLLKTGALASSARNWELNSFVLAGYSLYAVSFFLWMRILKKTPLYMALCGASLIYITIAYGSHFFLGEPLTIKSLTGTILVAIGVCFVGCNGKYD